MKAAVSGSWDSEIPVSFSKVANYKGEDGAGGYGEHHQKEKSEVAIGHVWRMDKDRRANLPLGSWGNKEKRKVAEELDRDR